MIRIVPGTEEGGLPPQALELEQHILGACLVSAEALGSVIDFLRPESFYDPSHICIWRAIAFLHGKSREVNEISVCQRLRETGELDGVGGPFYISKLTLRLPSTAGVEYNAHIIAQKHMLRQVIEFSHAAIADAYADTDCFDVLDGIRSNVDEALRYTQPRALVYGNDDIESLVDGVKPSYIRWSMPELSEKALCYGGLVHTVAGRTGLGKSIFSCEQAWAWTEAGHVLMFTPEMTKRQVQARILARESGVPYSRILAANMSEQDQSDVFEARQRIEHRLQRLVVDEMGGVTPSHIRAKVNRAAAEHPVCAVVIDHLHEMKAGIDRIDNDPSSRSRFSYCISELSEIAKTSGLPFLVMAQLNRDVEKRGNRRPVISDILWSGDVEQKSAFIGLLYREGYYQEQPPYEDILELIVAKYRDGGVGLCRAKVIPSLSRIGDAAAPQLPHPDDRTETAPF